MVFDTDWYSKTMSLQAAIADSSRNPFNDSLIASGSDDGKASAIRSTHGLRLIGAGVSVESS